MPQVISSLQPRLSLALSVSGLDVNTSAPGACVAFSCPLGISLIDADRDGTTPWLRSPAMTIPTCPVCLGTAVALLATPSDYSLVDYYRCGCGHVWTADKANQSVVTHVTPLPTLRPTPQLD